MCTTITCHQEKFHKSPLHKIDPRTKLLISFFFAVTITTLHSILLLSTVLGMSILFLILAKVSLSRLLTRLVPLVPFLIPIALILPILIPGKEILQAGPFTYTLEGIKHSFILIIRMLSIVFVFTCVIATSGRQELLTAALRLGIPKIFIQIAEFTFRYIEVLVNEAKTMLIARLSRGYTRKKFFNFKELNQLGNIIGMLFLRSYWRSERIYLAMLARGYSSEIINNTKTSFKKSDLALSAGMLVIFIFLLVVDRGGLKY
ncbi:MAG: cobalt/nickel transport system permease protein [Clostridia bacterium]|nr:cobalt/nickel transport system permease protein [Clostridia bacterium]